MTMIPNQKQIEYCRITDLQSGKNNPRKHSKKQIRQIAASIEEFGFTNPVLIGQDRAILAGHGRVQAAKLLGMMELPCLFIEHMSEAQKRAYVLADNQIALNATWDQDVLAEELRALSQIDPGFDLELTGFTIAELDGLLDLDALEEDKNPDHERIPVKAPRRVEAGDIWELGSHRLICGDSLDPGTVSRLMGKDKARMVFTDPPYNVPIDGHVSGKEANKHREFAMASGEMSPAEFKEFLRRVFVSLTLHSIDGAIHFICMDWRHMGEVLDAATGIYAELKNLIVWAKDQGGMGTFLSFPS